MSHEVTGCGKLIQGCSPMRLQNGLAHKKFKKICITAAGRQSARNTTVYRPLLPPPLLFHARCHLDPTPTILPCTSLSASPTF